MSLASYSAGSATGGGIIAIETIGTGLIILVYLFGYIGGAQFNPSVTLGVFITQSDFKFIDFISYVTVQCIGGIFGGLFVYGIGGYDVGTFHVDYNHDRFKTSQAFFAEILFTFNLVSTVLHVATSAIKMNNFYGLAIGSSLGTAVASVGINGISGACLNFAVWLGTTIGALAAGLDPNQLKFDHLWIYFVAPLIGACIAAFIFKYLYQDYDLDSEVDYEGERSKHSLRRYVAEFIGTAYLVCIIKLVSASYDDGSFTKQLTAAVGVGFALISLIYQWGYISQAHFNPAITIGVYLHGDIEGFEYEKYITIAMYIVMQLLGGFCGGLIAYGIGNEPAGKIYPDIIDGKEDYQVFGAEFMFTFLLVTLLIINVTIIRPDNGIPNTISGVSVGWMVMSAIATIGSLDAVSGCCLNPAVWFGTIMSAACTETKDLSDIKFQYIWVYIISEILAGCTAGLFVRYLWKEEEIRGTKLSCYVAEFLGTFFLISIIKLSTGEGKIISIGFGLCILIYCFGCISGAHFNPAVSIGVYCRGYVDGFYPGQYMNLLGYIISQLLGALFGGLYAWGVDGKHNCKDSYPHVADNITSHKEKAFAAEYIFTFLLVSSVIHCGVGQQPNDFYGMTIGFTVLAAVQLIGPISGACLNPAVWFGTIISAAICNDGGNDIKWNQAWIYLFATIFGGITAGFVYRLLYYEPEIPRAINEPEYTSSNPNVISSRDIDM